MSKKYVLAINPGSTSTKIAIYEGEHQIAQESINHSSTEVDQYEKIADQYDFRKEAIIKWLKLHEISLDSISAVIGRGGLLRPMPSGIYKVTDQMVTDLRIGYQGEHASNLGGMIAKAIGDMIGAPSFIADPVAVDEFEEVARISGMPEIKRRSLVHALNVKAIAHRTASEMGKKVEEMNMVIAHLGGGISIVPMCKGKMIDANNANEMGPFSPERTGSLPVVDLMKLCYSGQYTESEMKKKIKGKGGMTAYLGTNDAREVLKRIESGDKEARLIFEAMGYQIAKEIGAMATVLKGKVDVIVLTGGVAYSQYLTDYIKERVSFIAPVDIKPGEDEMKALNDITLRALNGEEKIKIYEDEVEIND